jgi:hypothetical protein
MLSYSPFLNNKLLHATKGGIAKAIVQKGMPDSFGCFKNS